MDIGNERGKGGGIKDNFLILEGLFTKMGKKKNKLGIEEVISSVLNMWYL